jgi:uncharacterized protein
MDKVTWFELPADDTARASDFYKSVFGWKMSDMGGGSLYAMTADSDEDTTPKERGSINGDISPCGPAFDKPLIVIEVQDMDAKLTMVQDAGGTIALQPTKMDEPAMLWSIVTDTEGNNIGIIQNL